MYIFSFFKSLLRPRHILPTLYFLVNCALVFLIFYYFMPFELHPDPTTNGVILGLIGLGVNLFFIIISLSPLGEFFWRLRNNIQSAPRSAAENNRWNIALNAFEEVKAKAVQASRSVSNKVKLYYSPTDEINAYALGHRTVILTRGILAADPEYLKGVLAHEFGHIAHGDSDLKLGINVSNSILTIFMTFVSVIANFIIGILGGTDSNIGYLLYVVCRIVLNIIIMGLFKLWTLLGVLLLNMSSRKEEFLADGFAKELGYDEQLARFLNAIDGSGYRTNKFDLMFQTHPDTVDRLENLGFKVA